VAKNKAERAAEKALDTARIAVGEAQKAVKNLDKKTRKDADELAGRLEQAAKDAKKAIRRAKKTAVDARRAAAQVAEHVTATASNTGIPTFRELRDRAKSRGIQGYSRMNKAELLHALGEG
jgi:predicted  nucleic acid-binding Zn-ribbon protein